MGSQHGDSSTKVLIADDDRVESGVLAFHLRKLGFVVMHAATLEEALDACAWASPTVVIAQAHGRDTNGFTLMRALGAVDQRRYLLADGPLPVDDELDALRLGVLETFAKPLDPSSIGARLKQDTAPAPVVELGDLPDGAISGSLKNKALTDLVRLCHRHRLHARIHVEFSDDWGVLLLRHGQIIDCEAPNATGRDGVYRLLREADGAYVVYPLDEGNEDLEREDVVGADIGTLVQEAFRAEVEAARPSLGASKKTGDTKQSSATTRSPLSIRQPGSSPFGETREFGGTPIRAEVIAATLDDDDGPARVRRSKRTRVPAKKPSSKKAPSKKTARPPSRAGIARPASSETLRDAQPVEVDLDEDTDQRQRRSRPPARVARAVEALPEPGLDDASTDHGTSTDHEDTATGRVASSSSGVPAWLPTVLAAIAFGLLCFVVYGLATKPSVENTVTVTDPVAEVDPTVLAFGQAILAEDEGGLDRAEAGYRGVLKTHPEHLGALSRLSSLLIRADRLDEARPLINTLKSLKPEDGLVHAAAGILAADAGDGDAAAAAFKLAKTHANDNELRSRLKRLTADQ